MNEIRKLLESLDQIATEAEVSSWRDVVEITSYSKLDPTVRAVVNNQNRKILFVGSDQEAREFVEDLPNQLKIGRYGDSHYAVHHDGDVWFVGSRDECKRFLQDQ